jgi:hypothetical protein
VLAWAVEIRDLEDERKLRKVFGKSSVSGGVLW